MLRIDTAVNSCPGSEMKKRVLILASLLLMTGMGTAALKCQAVGDEELYTICGRSNLRKTPSVEGSWIMTIPEGAQVRVLGGEKDGYTLIEYDGTKGYVSAEQIYVPGSEIAETVEDSNVITAQAVRDSAMDAVKKREEQAQAIALEMSAASKQAVMIRVAAGVNFRREASATSSRLDLLQTGDVVQYIDGGENGFLHVKYNGTEGYVLASCLEYMDVNPAGRSVANNNSVIPMQQVALVGGEGIQGSQTVTATASSAMVTEKKSAKKDSKQISYQIGVKTSMRGMPGESDDLLASLPAGTSVMLLGEKDGYAMVQYDGMVGYVLGDDLMNSVEYARLNGEATLFTITGYCSCRICCGQYSPEVTGNIPHTATGTVPEEGRTIAVDPKVIPYGTHVTIEGMGTYIAEDCGGGITNNHIDMYFNSHEDALKFGKRQLYVTIQ